MDYIHFLGSIASIISLVISFGFVLWSIIKKSKISFFNLYMLVVVLIQAISVGFWLWNGKNLIAMIVGMFLMFTILSWLVMYLNEKQLDLIQSQLKISKSQTEMIKEINQDMGTINESVGEVLKCTMDTIEIIKELTMYTESKINVNTERLEDEMKKLQKKIGKKKPTK